MSKNLPISRLVKVDVVLAAMAAQAQNLNTLLVLTSSAVIDVVERIRTYNSIDAVAEDFGTSGPEYKAAVLWYQQSPQPKQIKLGRWAKTATAGKLLGGLLSASEQAIANWNVIANPKFKIAIDGAAAVDIAPASFVGATNLNAIADRIQTALDAAVAGVQCVWNATYSRFEITSGTTGAASKISFLTAPADGTDISGMLKGLSTSSGAYVADGIAAETALAAATLFDGEYGQTWYALVMPEATDDEHVDVAGYIEATNNKHVYGITSQNAGILSGIVVDDIASRAKALKYDKTMVQYSSKNAYAVCSLLARALTVNYNGNKTVITLMYKQEPGIEAESLTETQIGNLEAKNCNVFVAYNNDTAIIEPGKVASGDFIDTITGADAFSILVMNAVYNLLYTSTTKIPQTDAGTQLIVTTIAAVCSQFVANGYLAPGVWDQDGFGELAQGDFLDKGFYIYAPPVASQAKADRQARRSVPIQVAAKCAGAVHTVDVILNISR